MFFFACSGAPEHLYSSDEAAAVTNVIKANNSLDSLLILCGKYEQDNYKLGQILVYKELGKRYRDASDFNEAMEYHRRGLETAMQIEDTLEMVQAFNNIGTDYRRLGILEKASTYHYKALKLCGQYTDKESFTAKKNRVISLNGIGNIHLTLGNRDAADSTFRAALVGETELGSDLGKAINYANLGSIFEAGGMMDSALLYYRISMKHNIVAKSNLGISLCHAHFGRMAEKKGNWDEALKEYRDSYNLMEKSSDRWHWMESCIALARVNISKEDMATARMYLDKAEECASQMNSLEYLSEIYRLNFLYYQKQRDFRKALEFYTQSIAYADSVKNTKALGHIYNLRVNYEKEKSLRELMIVRQNHEIEQRTKNIFLITSLIVLFLTIAAIGFLWYALRMKLHSQNVMRYTEKVRSNFFTNITHEFRTPLTVILGLTEQLQKGKIEKKEVESALVTISRQGNNLLDLVNQLLDISKVRSEVGEPQWRSGNAVAYIRMIVENYRMYARQKQIDFRYLPAENEVVMDFVPEYLRKIIHNLLSNAIKFTSKEGLITITTVQEKETFVIKISDTGCGIAQEDIKHIFDAFYQGKTIGTQIGTGIGLALVQQMTGSMGGKIEVNSALGKGAEFTISIPIKHGNVSLQKWEAEKTIGTQLNPEREYTAEQEESLLQHESALHKQAMPDEACTLPSVLVIEDNADISYYIGGLLKGFYRVLYAENGVQGVERASEQMPDLIITDLMMPEMDGYEFCGKVRNSAVLNHIPIIVITAKCEEEDRIKGLEAGVDAYLQKPFSADELHVRIKKLLEQRRILREKYSRALHEGVEQTVTLNVPDREFLNRLTNIIYAGIGDVTLNSDKIADKMCMSKSQLNRKVHTITGYSTAAYILQIRLEKAKRMLASTQTLIGDIAIECGFEDSNYFSRLFKQVFKTTPTQYRKNCCCS